MRAPGLGTSMTQENLNDLMWAVTEDRLHVPVAADDDKGNAHSGTGTINPVFTDIQAALQKSHAAHGSDESDGMHKTLTSTSSEFPEKKGPSWVISPTDSRRLIWDLLGGILLAYDFIFIPISVFNIGKNMFVTIMDWITLCFWTIDMFTQFLTGYVSQGRPIMDPAKIAWNYIKGWFVLDMLIIGPDWAFTIMSMLAGNEGQDANLTKILRSVRIFRLIRLLRAAKLKRLYQKAIDNIETEEIFLVFAVARTVVCVILFNHLAAAVWYFIGDIYKPEDGLSWIQVYRYDQKPLMFRYTISLYWSIANFGLGSSPVFPQNSVESAFSICLIIAGMVTFTLFISMVTTWMSQLASAGDDPSKQLWLLRRFFRQQRVQGDLCWRILRFLEYKIENAEDKVVEAKLDVLNLLSKSLKREFRYEVSYASIRSHPLFRFVEHRDPLFLGKVGDLCFGLNEVMSDEPMFVSRTAIKSMYFVGEGKLTYSRGGVEPFNVRKEDWLCEQSLWLSEWSTCGDLVTTSLVQIILVDLNLMRDTIVESGDVWSLMTAYAAEFVSWLGKQVVHSDLFSVNPFRHHANEFMTKALDNLDQLVPGVSTRMKVQCMAHGNDW
jgi:hypothetical protein